MSCFTSLHPQHIPFVLAVTEPFAQSTLSSFPLVLCREILLCVGPPTSLFFQLTPFILRESSQASSFFRKVSLPLSITYLPKIQQFCACSLHGSWQRRVPGSCFLPEHSPRKDRAVSSPCPGARTESVRGALNVPTEAPRPSLTVRQWPHQVPQTPLLLRGDSDIVSSSTYPVISPFQCWRLFKCPILPFWRPLPELKHYQRRPLKYFQN